MEKMVYAEHTINKLVQTGMNCSEYFRGGGGGSSPMETNVYDIL